MYNAELIHHKGKEVLIMDLSNIPPVEVIRRIRAVEDKIVEYDLGTVLLVVNTTKLAYNKITSTNLNDFSGLCGKFIKASAVLDEMLEQRNKSASSTSEGPKKSTIFSNKEEALNWLVTQ